MSSTARVEAAAAALGLGIRVMVMPSSTRTAEEAAAACGCDLDQIVKSLVFRREEDAELHLLLVAGGNRVDPVRAAAAAGGTLGRAAPDDVRTRTGFAIGGVAPIGHLTPLPVLMDPRLLDFPLVWAAAGAPNAVFSVDPAALARATGARVVALSA